MLLSSLYYLYIHSLSSIYLSIYKYALIIVSIVTIVIRFSYDQIMMQGPFGEDLSQKFGTFLERLTATQLMRGQHLI